jgi:hypothetical protein
MRASVLTIFRFFLYDIPLFSSSESSTVVFIHGQKIGYQAGIGQLLQEARQWNSDWFFKRLPSRADII